MKYFKVSIWEQNGVIEQWNWAIECEAEQRESRKWEIDKIVPVYGFWGLKILEFKWFLELSKFE